jgi:hypothetical protein
MKLLPLVLGAFVAGCAAPRAQMPPVVAAPVVVSAPATTSPLKPGEGSDLELGGFGLGAGHFVRLRDITFGTDGRLFTLESAGREKSPSGAVMGMGRVQVFDASGHFQSAFSIGNDAQSQSAANDNEDGPMAAARLAVDSANRVYVSFPVAGLVRVFDAKGNKLNDIALPGAKVLARSRDGQIVAIASNRLIENGHWTWKGGDKMFLLSAKGIERSVALGQTLWNVQDVEVAPNGDVLALGAGALRQYDWNPAPLIWRFGATGKVVSSLGSGNATRSEDGSEPLHSLAVSSNGDISAMTYGNPGFLVRYSADGKRITRRQGQFKWADQWSAASGYTILAIDPSNRLWVGVTQPNDPGDPNLSTRSERPVVLRAEASFFDPAQKGVLVADARSLGFAPLLVSTTPGNISYEAGKPLEADVVVAPAKRNLSGVLVSFRVFDASGHALASGQKSLALRDGEGARLPLEFTPPRFGSYSLVADYQVGADTIASQAIFFGVTPRFPNMPVLGDTPGGWEDAPRQAFTGLKLMRLHPDKGDAKLDADLAAAKQAGDVVFVQLTDKKERFTPARAREVMERIKGRVRYVELFNEPNFQFKPEEYVARAKPVYDAIKAVDPSVRVLGPAVCGIALGWHEAFYKVGGKATCDILSVHDYEGHESISPEHWTWKLGALRALMARYGDGDKPVWQTERAISSVRGGTLTGLSQAIRVTLHRDLLSSLGVPDDHNAHYYLNQGGYSDVPSYEWSAQGPLPGAMATRTRAALIGNRSFTGKLDFGPTGNSLLFGARYHDASGETISLRNLIGAPMRVEFAAPTGAQVFDAWGNALPAPIRGGVLTLNLEQLPTYVRLSGTGTLKPKPWNWGRNLALNAKVSVQGKSENDLSNLTNGKLETIHVDNPLGSTDGKAVLRLTDFSPAKPAIVSLQLGAPAHFNSVIVRGLRADNTFSALLDFDVQAKQNGVWKTVSTFKANIPPSVSAPDSPGSDAKAITFYGDDNAWVLRFAPVQSDALRLVIRRGTFGFAPDDVARAQVVKTWGSARPQAASLREIEIYNAP